MCGTQSSESLRLNCLGCKAKLWKEWQHMTNQQWDSRGAGSFRHLYGFVQVDRDRLFDQCWLTGGQGFQHHIEVLVCGQADRMS